MSTDSDAPPTLDQIQAARRTLLGKVRETPAWTWEGRHLDAVTPEGATIINKLELFQHAGSFKARGANNAVLSLNDDVLGRGIITASGGNHGTAVAYAGHASGAKTVVYLPERAAAAMGTAAGATVTTVGCGGVGTLAGPVADPRCSRFSASNSCLTLLYSCSKARLMLPRSCSAAAWER